MGAAGERNSAAPSRVSSTPVKAELAVILLCATLRLGLMAIVAPWSPDTEAVLIGDSDPRGYHQLALHLMTGKGYLASDPERARAQGVLSRSYPGELEALWPPGYPAFLACLYLLFGVRLTPVILAQIALAAVACWMLMRSTERLWGARAGIGAGILYAIEPVSIFLTHQVLSEALFLPLLCAAVYCLAGALTAASFAQRQLWLIGFAAVMGAACWVRVSGLPLFVLAAVILGRVLWRSERDIRMVAVPVVLMGVVFLLVLASWYWRNYRAFGAWAFSTSGSYNLLAGFEYGGDKEAMFRKAYEVARQSGVDPESLNPFQRARFWRQTALAEWRADIRGNLMRNLKRLTVMMLTPGVSAWGALLRTPTPRTETADKSIAQIVREFLAKAFSAPGLIGIYTLLYLAVFYSAVGIGVLRLGRLSQTPATRAYVWIAVALAVGSIATTVVMSDSRGRAPAITLLTPLVGATLSSALSRRRFPRA